MGGGGPDREIRSESKVGSRTDVLVFAAAEERCQGAQEASWVPERAVLFQLEGEEPLTQEDHRLRPRQYPRIRGQPELQRELPDQPIPECMESDTAASV